MQYQNSRNFFMKSFANNTLKNKRITLYDGNQKISSTERYFDFSEVPPYKVISIRSEANLNTREYYQQPSSLPMAASSVYTPSVVVYNFDVLGKVYGILGADYNGNSSIVVFLSPEIWVDKYGNVAKGIFYTGYLGELRVGDLLPHDYGDAN